MAKPENKKKYAGKIATKNPNAPVKPIKTDELWRGIGDSGFDYSTAKYNPSDMLQQSSNYLTPSNITDFTGLGAGGISVLDGVKSPYKYSSDYPAVDNILDTSNEAFVVPGIQQNTPESTSSFNFDWGPLTGSGTAIKDFVGTDAFKNTASALFQGLGYMNSRASLKETKANNAYNRDMMNKQYGQFIDDKAGLSAIDWTSRDTSPQAQVDYNARKAAETTRLQNIK